MNEQLFKELAFKAGFAGSNLANTQFGTCYEHALKNFLELVVEECISACQTDNLGKTVSVEDLINKRFGIE